MFTPYNIGIAHILSYKNKFEILYKVLLESQSKAAFSNTVNEENPLSISVFMDHKSCIDICLKYLKKEFFKNNNKLAYVPLGNCLTEINKLHVLSIPKLYKTIFRVDKSIHLPNYCIEGTNLPNIYYADSPLINVEELLPNDSISTHGHSIVFYNSLCPLNIDIGTSGSIDFLESLLNCEYNEIFRTKIVQVLLRDKWQKIKWSIYAQSIVYIVYLIQLSFYCTVFIESSGFLVCLFVVHILLFLYEVIQIATDFYDY